MATFQGIDNFESYTVPVELNGLDGGSGWNGVWVATADVMRIATPGFKGNKCVQSLGALGVAYRDLIEVTSGSFISV
jgi:hypothetical protein